MAGPGDVLQGPPASRLQRGWRRVGNPPRRGLTASNLSSAAVRRSLSSGSSLPSHPSLLCDRWELKSSGHVSQLVNLLTPLKTGAGAGWGQEEMPQKGTGQGEAPGVLWGLKGL